MNPAGILPVVPPSLPKIAHQLLARISKEPLAGEIVIGGGIALKHYVDYRPTQDIAAWWRAERNSEAFDQIVASVSDVASQNALGVVYRHFGTTDSLELKDLLTGQKVFSFQIAVRDIGIDSAQTSSWPPIQLETLRDNIGSKMNALVNRGAPRDFVDIFEIVHRGLATRTDCWMLWQTKNPAGSLSQAQIDVIASLERIAQRRPLESLVEAEREPADKLRAWFGDEFCKEISDTQSDDEVGR